MIEKNVHCGVSKGRRLQSGRRRAIARRHPKIWAQHSIRQLKRNDLSRCEGASFHFCIRVNHPVRVFEFVAKLRKCHIVREKHDQEKYPRPRIFEHVDSTDIKFYGAFGHETIQSLHVEFDHRTSARYRKPDDAHLHFGWLRSNTEYSPTSTPKKRACRCFQFILCVVFVKQRTFWPHHESAPRNHGFLLKLASYYFDFKIKTSSALFCF